jgi:sugar O-acyltransferase (sialic acid O-acetyltransferase NeuD family)
MNEMIGVYGASGFGREVMAVLRTTHQKSRLCFIDDAAGLDSQFNGIPVESWSRFLALSGHTRMVAIAIADPEVRRQLAVKCNETGIRQCNIIASNVFIGDEIRHGEGIILQPFVTLTANIIIGRGFHANIYSYVAHDCDIGDYVTFAPGVKCNGNVTIGDGAYIGTGAVLRQGVPGKPLRIGAAAIVGMGAVVLNDVADGETVVGNPARPLVRRAR